MKSGKIRIIGGRWKGKKISYNLDTTLRPTPDRAKEMVFNWLGQDLHDLNCLDLFSGIIVLIWLAFGLKPAQPPSMGLPSQFWTKLGPM